MGEYKICAYVRAGLRRSFGGAGLRRRTLSRGSTARSLRRGRAEAGGWRLPRAANSARRESPCSRARRMRSARNYAVS